ncbi:MAG: bifunctional phosphoglucose/phosphomannose isomerase [Candidatus Bathyarchaeota archaeon]|nr:bifunctional phosphoglucose/phosphomannose isomerase [Candidatus Bathyarchaeota archaeon]
MAFVDNIDATRSIDKDNMLSYCVDAAKHYRESAENAQKIRLNYSKPANIIIAGMGGSGIGGELIKDYTHNSVPIPIEVNKDYYLPAYANEKTLALMVSYSGKTEETLSSFLDAIKRNCMIFCITSGGPMLEYAQKLGLPYLQVRGGMQPRAALPHLFVPLLVCMEKLGFAPRTLEDLSQAITLMKQISVENAPQKPADTNPSKTLALNLHGAAPVVYGSDIYRGVVMRWKQQFNENSKVPAKWEVFSELNHNEIVGWENDTQLGKDYAAVLVRDQAESVAIRSRIKITKGLMQSVLPKQFEFWARGDNDLAKMLSTVLVGDFVSVYLALLRNVDPTPVNSINTLKKQLEENKVKEKVIRELEKLAAK